MKHTRLSRSYQVVLALVVLSLCGAARASADSIALSNVQLELDLVTLSASISAALEAHSDTASSVFLDGLSVSVFQDGVPVDLSAGPTTLDDLPFFTNTPPFLQDGGTLGPVVLFRLLGLVPDASYTASFFLSEGVDPLEIPSQDVFFTVPPSSGATPVPEPASLLLLGMGAASLWGGRRRHKTDHDPCAPAEDSIRTAGGVVQDRQRSLP
jgi:hypothetical protein